MSQQDRGRSNETIVNAGSKELVDLHKDLDVGRMQAGGEKLETGDENNGK